MAMAMICDRCGQMFSPDKKEKPRYVVLDCNKDCCFSRNEGQVDLCPDCEKKLEAWMAEKE